MIHLPDVQKSTEGFKKIPINKVGVRNIKIPLKLRAKNSPELFQTVANVSSYCNLVADVKGINMSRISRTINDTLKEDMSFDNLNKFVYNLQKAHNTDDIFIKAEFPYIYVEKTPLTKIDSYEPVKVSFESILQGTKLTNYLTVESYEMSLCPCSKEMSLLKNNITDVESYQISKLSKELQEKIYMAGFGAHNQKSEIRVRVELLKHFWIEDIIDIIKKGSSCPTLSTLKRPDEKWVTEVSYLGGYFDEYYKFIKVEGSGPKFVEDIARDISFDLNQYLDKEINDYIITVNNHESIHSSDIIATSVLSAGRLLT